MLVSLFSWELQCYTGSGRARDKNRLVWKAVKSVKWWHVPAVMLVFPTNHHLDNLSCAKTEALPAAAKLDVAGSGDFCVYIKG